MGNKHDVAPVVAEISKGLPAAATFVDVFCGMCSVGGAIAASTRPVVGNDVQSYAALVARCLVATPDEPPSAEALERALRRSYLHNRRTLMSRFAQEVHREDGILERGDIKAYRDRYETWRHAANDESVAAEVAVLAKQQRATPYQLATLTFSWGYFGLRQAIDVDSIRYAIDRALATGRLSESAAEWALVALLQASSCASASPGHFAQYLKPTSEQGFARIANQRRRRVWDQFLHEVSRLQPYGEAAWRSRNAVLNSDAAHVWQDLDALDLDGAVVYADPPYSKDHYSRYYHVLETLALYDYPGAAGIGRYRPDRFATPFSIKSQVEEAFRSLARSVAERNFTLILSYPSNGLLSDNSETDPHQLLCQEFESVTLVMCRPTKHSTLGARHGKAHNDVRELLWVAA